MNGSWYKCVLNPVEILHFHSQIMSYTWDGYICDLQYWLDTHDISVGRSKEIYVKYTPGNLANISQTWKKTMLTCTKYNLQTKSIKTKSSRIIFPALEPMV